MTFPGKTGSVIYLQNYLSTMFQISDVLIDKEEVAMILNINITLPDNDIAVETATTTEHEICVSEDLASVSKSHIEIILQKMAKVLESQGISCFQCPKSRYKLFPLSDDCQGRYFIADQRTDTCRFGLAILCGDKQVCSFELTLTPKDTQDRRI